MKGQKTLLKRFKYVLIVVVLILTYATMNTYATDTTGTIEGDSGDTASNLPYIEMKVRPVKVGTTNQITVECWGSKFNKLEGMEMVFSYDSNKLTPSQVNDNVIMIDLDSIKYDKRPDDIYGDSTEDIAKFDIKSTTILSKSFEVSNEYKDLLSVSKFKYLAPVDNIETMQILIGKTKSLPELNADEPTLLGTFSFKQTDNTTIDGTEFNTSRIKIYCNDYEDTYTREQEKGEDCTEIIEFTYERYGSISGKISASIKSDKEKELNKNYNNPIATIKIYKKEAVEEKKIDWSATGTTYANYRTNNQLPESCLEPITIVADDEGNFKIENIEFGTYDLLIDKDYYADVIITNIVINSDNKDINLVDILKNKQEDIINDGVINLIPGDIDKDGKLNAIKDPKLFKNDSQKKLDSEIDLDDFKAAGKIKNFTTDATMFKRATQIYKGIKGTIKRVIEL